MAQMNQKTSTSSIIIKKILPDDFYFWSVEITNKDNKKAAFNGSVRLKTSDVADFEEIDVN